MKNGKNKVQVISITSGKGGVGKTLTTVNLATAASQLGKKVLILDGDFGLANVDVVLGLSAKYSISDVLDGNVSMDDIILEGPLGIQVIPSGSGISRLTQLTHLQRMQLFDQVHNLEAEFDTIFVDTGAGIAESVLHFNSCADQLVVVTTPEPHALTDAYAMIKVMHENYGCKDTKVIVNMVQSNTEGERVFERLSQVTKKFLSTKIDYLGCVPRDPQILKYIALRQAASANSTHTVAGQAWIQIARHLFDGSRHKLIRDEEHVWRELIWTQQKPVAARI